MLRSLHMKLVMIMVLLILSLMTVVGAFLMNSVVAFYLNDFYAQVNTVFSDRDVYNDMSTQTPAELAGETSGVEGLDQLHEVSGVTVPRRLAALKGKERRFDLTVQKQEMDNVVLDFLK